MQYQKGDGLIFKGGPISQLRYTSLTPRHPSAQAQESRKEAIGGHTYTRTLLSA